MKSDFDDCIDAKRASGQCQRWILIAMAVCVPTLFSCRHLATDSSHTKEAPDIYGEPGKLGLTPPYKWDEIKGSTQAAIAHPWSDTYWPLAERGLASRYAANGSGGKVAEKAATLLELVQLNQAAERSADQNIINYLSPAEKIDLLLHAQIGVPAATMNSLKDNDALFRSAVKIRLDPLDQKALALQKTEADTMQQYQDITVQLNQLQVKLLDASGHNDTTTVGRLNQQITDLKTTSRQLENTIGDLDKQATQLSHDRRQLLMDFNKKSAALVKNLASIMPVTAESYQTWYSWETSDTEDYSWMGHCHGWAPASLLEAKPQRAVLAAKNGKKVLFTEGDIRGLMTKLWAEQAPSGEFFGARRCGTDKYPADEFGRITDGLICYGKTSGDCTDPTVGQRIYVKNNRIESGMIEYTEAPTDSAGKIATTISELDNDHYSVVVFRTAADFAKWDRSGRRSYPGTARKAVLFLTTGCRDVNPMTYHLALTKLIKEKKQGFVFDRMRSSQVWNQPVFGYELTYLPIKLNAKDPSGKTLSVAGEPVAISDIIDPFAVYRAPGTAYLVTVAASVAYGVENGAFTLYKKDGSDEATEHMATTYTLELDAQKNLIGGEWGAVPNTDPNSSAEENNRHLIGGDAPDFIWFYPASAKPTSGAVNKDIVTKIHACSLLPSSGTLPLDSVVTDAEGSPILQSKNIEFVNCPL